MSLQFLLKIIKERMQKPEELNLYYTDSVITELFYNKNGETEKIVSDFLFFLEEYGYILKKRRLPSNVKVRSLNDYNEENYLNLPFFIDQQSRNYLSKNYVSDVLNIDNDGKSVFKLFVKDYQCNIKDFNAISFMIFFDSYVAFFVNSFGKKFYLNKKPIKDLQSDLNKQKENMKILFEKMLENK